ncbi:hypothetical protein N657DRAFT_110355 [Parathielavia appendiculata]|uniref:Uncharacterized protein n=1 Tax=Parathielavia appendiculata TaxID=2587402 RepID=A0AAN6TVR0_9PEZI|nr:hypothetical protein N657DRAFT_110355 [Parathielavia appendiculata]
MAKGKWRERFRKVRDRVLGRRDAAPSAANPGIPSPSAPELFSPTAPSSRNPPAALQPSSLAALYHRNNPTVFQVGPNQPVYYFPPAHLQTPHHPISGQNPAPFDASMPVIPSASLPRHRPPARPLNHTSRGRRGTGRWMPSNSAAASSSSLRPQAHSATLAQLTSPPQPPPPPPPPPPPLLAQQQGITHLPSTPAATAPPSLSRRPHVRFGGLGRGRDNGSGSSRSHNRGRGGSGSGGRPMISYPSPPFQASTGPGFGPGLSNHPQGPSSSSSAAAPPSFK